MSGKMMGSLLTVGLVTFGVCLPSASACHAVFQDQENKQQDKKEKPCGGGGAPSYKPCREQARWEGIVVRSSSEKSTLDVRKRGGNVEKTIHYDSSTKWTSQEHGSKKVNNIDASQIKDGDRVICLGTYDDKGDFHATLISKRLTN